ncbi:MAG: hypothetical protein OXF41_13350 [bacterium]|nr:hypothetical protein [bacterium]
MQTVRPLVGDGGTRFGAEEAAAGGGARRRQQVPVFFAFSGPGRSSGGGYGHLERIWE